MRGLIHSLDSALPLSEQLPFVYQEDEFARRFLAAFDAALAPVVATLDDLNAYVDPDLAPADFLDWLAGWMGIALAEQWSVEARREIVARAVSLHRRRGTLSGLADALGLITGCEIELHESGGAAWSAIPGTALPGAGEPTTLHVRILAEDTNQIDVLHLDAVVAAIKPAHVAHTIEIEQRPASGHQSRHGGGDNG